jgi:hypothetical protein
MATPVEWLKALGTPLDARRSDLVVLNDYFNGNHPLAFATAKFREAFGSLFSAFADNWCERVVYASGERLRVQGFRFGGRARRATGGLGDLAAQQPRPGRADRADRGDQARRRLPARRPRRRRQGADHDRAPVRDDRARTPRQPSQAVAGVEEVGRRRVGLVFANVYLPEGVHKFKTDRKAADLTAGGTVRGRAPGRAGGQPGPRAWCRSCRSRTTRRCSAAASPT